MNVRLLFGFLAIALCIAGISSPAAAWGPIGHRTTADIAERNISGHTRAHVERILGRQTLREAATVPDEQRNNPDPFWQNSPPWHYLTVPRTVALADIEHPAQGDAVTALDRFVTTLRDPQARPIDRQRALQFVVHLVSDLHMPLHAADDVYGGGGIRVSWFGQQQSLHWLWDEGMINVTMLSSAQYADRFAARTTPEEVLQWWDPRPATWIGESIALRNRVYAEMDELVPAANGQPLALGWQYQYDWRPEMELRLRQSGYRLAAYLDWIFAETG